MAGRQLPATPENLQRFMLAVIAEAKRHPDSWPFREPVNIAEAPDYYDLVKNPIDLQSLEQRVQTSR